MEDLGFDFEVVAPDIDEKAIRRNDPRELVMAVAQAKADALVAKIKEPAIIIASDQVVLFEDKIREKPRDAQEAKEFLQSYSRGPAETLGAVVVVNTATGKRLSDIQTSKVYFRPLPRAIIEEHIKSGSALRGAGGFLMHDPLLGPYIDHIEGGLDSAIGLSREVVNRLIKNIL